MTSNKYLHLTLAERQVIETGISHGSTKAAIAETLGKNKSTIGKEIKLHRVKSASARYPLDCSLFPKCKDKNTFLCNLQCPSYIPFTCKRRDRSPGACNGCEKYSRCHYDKYKYIASQADGEYRDTLVNTRLGVNATLSQIKELGLLIKPLLAQGQSVYAILQNHPEINLTEKTLYHYIEDGVFQNAGVPITCMDLKRQVRRKLTKKKSIEYSPRKDRSYLKGRTHKEYIEFKEMNPYASVVEMDTVYNDGSNGPFLQTFIFLKYGFLFCVYHQKKTAQNMLDGILLLESFLGEELFNQEVEVLITDRGSEFVLAEKAEIREDGTRRTRFFYCDPMASWQKGTLENIHLFIREICPKETDLYALGLDSQEKANRISSHINSYSRKKLNNKTSFSVLSFFNKEMADKLIGQGVTEIPPDQVTLKPYLLK
ncbi:helix-turn-helix domain-containing protein [Holdemania massiliensis]|jgi:IS30 family transposase|uniref:Helix-turn-helix domain-containing protein n=1 Tax=Holdemania massiliensis TaxID=1468449 RepID=A0A6N7SDC7_9FIRM|nr:helix-turn-helix domain-containing protein [Holdemania massiliensis]MSA73308.1 helix-turn-helix domain-containing protein [Holdemania massiliensis]MSA91515.1 helix-turn-helix domain-containing protein [Holdemania massiliensis]MSB80380.1 helix-turn-helix domain-containing protein [Holdemania massiliensis]MSC35249.1 helix-turn-helix domain-containing protein [Holdemania massiliensis]MSC41709.1 helix-turn-helix domain-containing protein [Holdemania massiliensis]